MLDIDPIFPGSKYAYGGSGIFDIAKNIIQKSSNSAIAKKVIKSATAQNLKKAANSTVGKEIKKSIFSGVTEASKNAAEGAFEKLGLPTQKKTTKNRKQKAKGIWYSL